MGKRVENERSGKRHTFSIRSMALLCAVIAVCVFSVSRMGDTADCGSEGSFTAAPRTMRAATAARGAWATTPITPDGNTYVVTTPEQLAWIAEQVNSGASNFEGKTISIEADLDLAANPWVPIGGYEGDSVSAIFKGTFLGNGHTISNMTITDESAKDFQFVGLIGNMENASVSGVHLRGAKVTVSDANASSIGMLVGFFAANTGPGDPYVIADCTVQGSLAFSNEEDSNAGGIVGYLFGEDGEVALKNCHILSGSTVRGTRVTGGLVGGMTKGSVDGCSFFGAEVSGAGTFDDGSDFFGPIVGGIAGQVSNKPTINGCVVSSDVKKTSGIKGSVGGIVGESNATSLIITNCLTRGTVSGSGPAVGGVLGYAAMNTTIENCTNEATVTNTLSGATTIEDVFSTKSQIGVGGIAGLVETSYAAGTTYTLSISSVANSGAVTMVGTPTGGDSETATTYYTAGIGGVIGNVYDKNSSGSGSISAKIERSANEGAVSVSGAATYASRPMLNYAVAVGGIAGLYNANTRTNANGYLELTASSSMADVTASLTGNKSDLTMYAGGLIGLSEQYDDIVLNNGSFLNITNSYSRGATAASGGVSYAGGLIGGANVNPMASVPYNEATITTSYAFMGALSAANGKGGLIGTAELDGSNYGGTLNDSIYGDDANALYPVGGDTASPLGRATTAAMSDGSAFRGGGVFDWTTNSAWNQPINTYPSLNYTTTVKGLVTLPGALVIAGGQSGTIMCSLLPNEKIRAAVTATYSAVTVPAEDQQKYFSSVTPTTDGVTFTSNGTPGIVKVRISAIGAAEAVPMRDAFVVIMEPETPVGEGTVSEFYVRNLPLTPEENTTRDVYIAWKAVGDAADAALRSADQLPDPLPEVSWSITPPVGGGHWTVSVDKNAVNPFRAALTIGSKTGSSSITRELYQVTVHMKQEGGIDETYHRGFYVGAPFPTQVALSTQVQELIDAANAILCRTGVMIVPGNHQPQIPAHILEMIAVHLRDNLVTYEVTESSARAADDDLKSLYVLTSLDQIEQMKVELPDSASLPECFVTTDKESANIELDLTKLNDPNAVGKLVILPMTYAVKIESDDMRDFYGSDADAIVAAPSGYLDRIFEVLVLHKRIKEGAMLNWYTRLVNGVASPQEAYDLGMLLLEGDTAEGSLTISLGYNVLNYHGESFVVQGNLQSDGSGEDVGYIVLPDGLENMKLIDPLWTNRWTSGGGGGGGGGGCATGVPFAIALLACAGVVAGRRKR